MYYSMGSGFGARPARSEFEQQMKRQGITVIKRADLQSRKEWLRNHGEKDVDGVIARHAVIVD